MSEPLPLDVFKRLRPEEQLTEIYSTQLVVLEAIRQNRDQTVDDTTMAELRQQGAAMKEAADKAQAGFDKVGR